MKLFAKLSVSMTGKLMLVFVSVPVKACPDMSRFLIPGIREAPYKTSAMFPAAHCTLESACLIAIISTDATKSPS